MKHLEQNAQITVIAWLRARTEILFTTPAGAGEYFDIRRAGRIKQMGYTKGCPDILIFEPRPPYHGLFIEMKAPKGRVSPAQEEFMGRLEKRGYCVRICRSAQEAIITITGYMDAQAANTAAKKD